MKEVQMVPYFTHKDTEAWDWVNWSKIHNKSVTELDLNQGYLDAH